MERIKRILDTKNKKILATVVATTVLVVSAFSVDAMSGAGNKQILKVIKNIDVEYGEMIPTEVKEYLDVSGVTKEETEKLLKNAKVSIKDIQNEEGKEYPAIGEYRATIVYQDEKQETKVRVKDTTAPVFNEVGNIQIEQGTTDFNYQEHIQATDLQEVTYEFKTENIDVNTVGEYTMTVVATDASSNVTEKEIQVVITEKALEPEEQSTETANNQTSNNTSSNNTNNRNNDSNTTNNDSSICPVGWVVNANGSCSFTIERPEVDLATHTHTVDGRDCVAWFNGGGEACEWAENYIDNQVEWVYSGYRRIYCHCGMVGVEFY